MTTAIHDVPVPRSSKWAACAFMLLLMLSLIMPNVAGAASLPAKEGLVQDTAGMIPKESVSYIKQAAQGNTYTYYLLTIDSFDGEIPSDYATSVYQAWKLTADDVLIVLSKQDRRVEMNFNNSALQAKIDALPDDYNGDGQVGQKLSEFVDAHFIPEAKKGNFARAAIALMQAAEGLKAPSGSSNSAGEAVGSGSNGPDASGADASNNSGQKQPAEAWPAKGPSIAERMQSLPWPTIALTLVVIALLIPILLFVIRLIAYKRLLSQLPAAMAEASSGLSRVQSFASLYQGHTLQSAKEIEAQLTDNLIVVQHAWEELGRTKLVKLLTSSYVKKYHETKTLLGSRNESNKQLHARITGIEETEKELVQGLQDSRERMQQLEHLYRSEQHARGWPLTRLEERAHHIIQQLQAVDDMDAFDPVGADELMGQVQALLQRYDSDVQSIASFAESYRAFPEARQQAVQDIEAIVTEQKLKLIRIDPYGTLARAEQLNEQMLSELKEGNMPEAVKHAEARTQLVKDAVQMTQRLKELKLRNSKDIVDLKEQILAYSKLDVSTHSWSSHAEQLYRKKHWEPEWLQVDYGRKAIAEASQELPRIEHLSSEEIQEYEEARQALDLHMKEVQAQHEQAKAFEALIHGLDQSMEQARRLQSRGDQAYEKGQSLIARHHLVRMWSQEENALSKLKAGVQQMDTAPPYDVELLTEVASDYQTRAEKYLQQVEYASVQKKNAEREIEQLERRYQSTYRKAQRKIHVSRYHSQHSSIMSSVDNLMRRGAYDQAAREAAVMAGLISSMESAYQSVLAEERRKEEARRAEQQRREQAQNSQSNGSSWSNSSGGSSWGSGSNSSGGASFGSDNNNNNQSSGGSNW